MGKRRIWSTPMFTTLENFGADRKRVFQEVHDALIAVGLTQTADTGQMADFESVVPAITSSRSFGYRIYKINDSLSIESPIYLKINFYCHVSSPSFTNVPDLLCSVGTGTNGAGGLTGEVVAPTLSSTNMCYSFSNTMFPNENIPSFVYSGEGITWLSLKCGYARGNNSSSYIARPDNGGEKSRHTWVNVVICRPLDDSGAVLPGFAIGAPSGSFSYSGTSLIYLGSNFLNYLVKSSTKEGVVSATTSPSGRIMCDAMGVLDTKPVLAGAYGKFGNQYLPLAGVASIPAICVNSMDTIDFAVAGVEKRQFICPHPGAYGLNRLDTYRHQGNQNFGSVEFDTLMLAWDGTDV